MRATEEAQFDTFILEENWDSLLTRYPLRESPAFDRVVEGLSMKDRATYQAAVLKLLQDEVEAIIEMRKLLGDLYSEVTT